MVMGLKSVIDSFFRNKVIFGSVKAAWPQKSKVTLSNERCNF